MKAIDQFKQKVKKHGLPKVMALGGDERALLDEALKFLRETALSQDSLELNQQKLTVGEDDIGQLDSMLRTMPFLAKVRVVEVHRAEKLDAEEIATVLDYIKRPSPSSLLILLYDKADKRNKLVSALISLDLMAIFDIPKKEDLIRIIINEARDHTIKVDVEVAKFLALVLDDDLLAIKSALSKLALLFREREVSIDDIEEHVVGYGEQDVFVLARHIGEGNLTDALCSLAILRSSQANALKFLGVLGWQFRTLVHLRHGLEQGLSELEIQKSVRVFGDRYQWMQRIAKKKNMEFHVARLTRLLECDASLKSMNIADPLNFIEKVVYQSVIGL